MTDPSPDQAIEDAAKEIVTWAAAEEDSGDVEYVAEIIRRHISRALQAEKDASIKIITDLRRKLALAGVEGSPPPGGQGTIPELLQQLRAEKDAHAKTKEEASAAIAETTNHYCEKLEAAEAKAAAAEKDRDDARAEVGEWEQLNSERGAALQETAEAYTEERKRAEAAEAEVKRLREVVEDRDLRIVSARGRICDLEARAAAAEKELAELRSQTDLAREKRV